MISPPPIPAAWQIPAEAIEPSLFEKPVQSDGRHKRNIAFSLVSLISLTSAQSMNLFRTLRNATLGITLTLTPIWSPPPSHARGGIPHTDVASTRHVGELPPEIQNALRRWQSACGTPLKAKPLFAHYLGDSATGYRLIALHFHELGCTNGAVLCTNLGCLHQVYISTDGLYRLAFSANVFDVTLRILDHMPAIEIDGGIFSSQTHRVLHWNGRRFIEE